MLSSPARPWTSRPEMSLVVTDTPQAKALSRSTWAYHVDVLRDWDAIGSRWNAMAEESLASPFQRAEWLDAWYKAFAGASGIKPLIVSVRDRTTGTLALALPLIENSTSGICVAEFADLNLTDYNAPILGKAAPREAVAADALWRTLCGELDGIDLIRLKKMPMTVGNRPNPLAILSQTSACQLNGNIVTTGDDFDAYRYSLERVVRKELERSWRVFTRHPDAQFRRVTNPDEALDVLAVMEAQQSTRMHDLGQNYILNEATAAAFYRRLIEGGLATGEAVMTALTCDGEIVASLLGVKHDQRYVMIRISNAGAQWSNCSPGRLIIERTMACLHAEGCRQFDFSIGNYDYKRRFGVMPIQLVDKTAALTWRGAPAAARAGAIQWLGDRPALDTKVRRAFGKLRPSSQAR
jgi:CelD/BcsL family acetyltransferase involved in cellulose biosynthesis